MRSRIVAKRKTEPKKPVVPTDHVCPFCGCGSTSRVRLPSHEVYWVQCDGCHAEGPKAGSLVSAVVAWNIATAYRDDKEQS